MLRCLTVVGVIALGSVPALAKPLKVELSGSATIQVVPTVAAVTVDVESRDPDALKTASQNAATTRRIVDSLKSIGLSERDIASAKFEFQQVRFDENRNPIPPQFVATNHLQVRLRDFQKIPQVIALAISSGATGIGDIRYSIESRQRFADKARKLAYADARANAARIAAQLGKKVGPIVSLEDNGADFSDIRPIQEDQGEGEADAPALTLEPLVTPGVVQVEYSIKAEYELR